MTRRFAAIGGMRRDMRGSIGGGGVVPTITGVVGTLYGGTNYGGSHTGGTSVTITGTGFTGQTAVMFGGVSATSITVVSDTSITCVTPAGTLGASVAVAVGSGVSGSGVGNGGWTYFSASTILGGKLWIWHRNVAADFMLNGSNVSQWLDSSGNGYHLTQGTPAKQPAYSATGWNGAAPGVTFDGSDDVLVGAPSLAAGSKPYSWVALQLTDTTVPVTELPWNIHHTGAGPTGQASAFRAGSDGFLSARINASLVTAVANDTGRKLVEINNEDGAGSSLLINGTAYGVGVSSATSSTVDIESMGAYSSGGTAANPSTCTVAEVACANAQPSAPEELAMRAYFRTNLNYGFTF